MLYDKIAPYLRAEPSAEPEGENYRQICIAIAKALGLRRITERQQAWLEDQVREGMWPFTIDLEDWLQSKGLLDTLAYLSPDECYRQIQAYRHRWLKHLCEQYELQEVFDKVATHLLKQKSRSYRKGGCAYRGKEGKMCAVGCLIANEHYRPSLEGVNVQSESIQAALKDSGINVTENMKFMLEDLQACHDYNEVSMWPQALRRIAGHYKLNTEVLK